MRKLIRNLLETNARRRIERFQHVRIDTSAKVSFRSIRMRQECRLTVGAGSVLQAAVAFERDGAEVLIGSNSFVGVSHIVCASRIEIGNDVLVSWGCTLLDSDLHSLRWSERANDTRNWWFNGVKDWTHVEMRPVKLGDKCWVGTQSIIAKGVEIGEGAIVAAGAVVTRNVPPWTIVGGNPAEIIRAISPAER